MPPRIRDGIKISREEIVASLLARDGNLCQYPGCDKEFTPEDPPTIDHFWVPLSLGGSWELDNLKAMHKVCNSRKSNIVPNPDGTLPKRNPKRSVSRAIKRSKRPEHCILCESGRILLPGEICPECDSGPQPSTSPKSLQRTPKECDHDVYHCFMCILGFIDRKAAIMSVIVGEDDI